MTNDQLLILASSSEPRRMLLERFKLPFESVSPDIDETPLPDEKPEVLVTRLAKEKAQLVSNLHPNAIIIGADQVGVFNGTILCKPKSDVDAFNQLSQVSGQTVQFLIGLCVLNASTLQYEIALEKFDITFRKLTADMIYAYLQKESVLKCAGSLKIEGLGIALAEKMHGDDYTALIGLPLIRLRDMLEKIGVLVL